MTTIGPHTGACLVCGRRVPVVNYTPRTPWGEAGYLARHWRPGLRRGYKCRGSFGGWVGRRVAPVSS